MLAVTAVLLIVGAGVFGAWAQRRMFRGLDPESETVRVEGLPILDLVIPVRLVVALVLAFVLVQTFASYQDASDHAADEAGAVLAEADAAALLPPAVGRPIAADLRCYARAVAGPEWEAMEESRTSSPVADRQSRRVTEAVAVAERGTAAPTVQAAVLAADERRVEARRGRLSEAEPSVPGVVTALLIFGAVVVVAGVAAFAHPAVRPRMRLALLVSTAAVFAATLLVIFDVDDPFGGFAAIQPTAMREAAGEIAETQFAGTPPCDTAGVPTARRPA